MKGKVKALGLGLVGVLAMGAVVAGVARAEGFDTLETAHGSMQVTLTASQLTNQVLGSRRRSQPRAGHLHRLHG